MTNVEKAPPALFQHCCTVFAAMRAEAHAIQLSDTESGAYGIPQALPEGQGRKRHALVYQGHTTRLFRELNLPSPYYTSILTALQNMGCIKQLSRGGGSAESRWELLDDPTMDLFFASSGVTPGKSRLALVEKQLADNQDRIAALEARLEETG